MRDHSGEDTEPGYSSLTRRERLERIARAERDRRAGRRQLAIASIGEPVEWPARAVLALASLSAAESTSSSEWKSAHETRRLLEEGLDLWARNAGLGDLDQPNDASDADDAPNIAVGTDPMDEPDPLGFDLATHPLAPDLATPLDRDELDRAFDEAEADVDAMHHVNEVAERVLLDEPIGFGDLSGDELTPVDDEREDDAETGSDYLGMDAAYVAPSRERPWYGRARREPAVAEVETRGSEESQRIVLATLETWLQNLERRKWESRKAGRAR